MKVIENSSDFSTEVKSGLVLVDFFATWCGPCKMLAPVLENIESDNKGKLNIIKVDVDNYQDLAQQFSISTIPTMVIFKDGNAVETLNGFLPKEKIMASLEKYI